MIGVIRSNGLSGRTASSLLCWPLSGSIVYYCPCILLGEPLRLPSYESMTNTTRHLQGLHPCIQGAQHCLQVVRKGMFCVCATQYESPQFWRSGVIQPSKSKESNILCAW
jgi:hypothetical protein